MVAAGLCMRTVIATGWSANLGHTQTRSLAPMPLRGLFAGQRRGHEFSDILAEAALSIEQTHFLKVCPGNKRHETNTISRDRGDKLADDRHATSAFNSRADAQSVSAFLADHYPALPVPKVFYHPL